jgi:WD40 repeat protein
MAAPHEPIAPAVDPNQAAAEATVSRATPRGDLSTLSLRPLHGAELPRDFDGAEVHVGHYRLLREIARGGMGVVYQAQDTRLKRVVALKMILSAGLASAEEVARFWTEAEAAAQLDHPHIVPVFETGEHEGRPFLVMAYLSGESLDKKLNAGPLAPPEAAKIIKPIAEAVAHAHRHGIIHRDIKPRNILFDDHGVPRITDFGLAKQVNEESDLTSTGQILGSPSYMSPEQAQAKIEDVGPLSDVYSLGATLYCLITGRPPFQAATVIETVRQVIDTEPAPPRQLNPAIDRDLETICLRCLEKEPRRRYASAEELSEELGRFLAGEPIRARRISVGARGWRWCRRKPAAAFLILAVFLAMVFSGLALGYRRQARDTELARQAAEELAAAKTKAVAAAEALAEANRKAAEASRQTAAAQEYFALVNKMREAAANPRPGWTWETLDDVRKAGQLDTPSNDPAELRTLAGGALGSVDVRFEGAVARGVLNFAAAFSPDGKRLAVSEWKGIPTVSIFVYDVATRERVATYSVSTWDNLARVFRDRDSFQEGLFSVAFDPTGRWLAAGTRQGRLYVWDTTAESAEPVKWWEIRKNTEIKEIAFSSDGGTIYTKYGTIAWSDDSGWRDFQPFDQDLPRFGFRADGVYADAWIVENHAPTDKLAGSREVAFASDLRHFASQGRDASILIFDRSRLLPWRRMNDPEAPETGLGVRLAFSTTGELLFSSDSDEAMRIWDLASGMLACRIPCDGVDSPVIAISPDGKRFALLAQKEARIYELRAETGPRVLALEGSEIRSMDISPGGMLLACSARISDGNLVSQDIASLWDVDRNSGVLDSAAYASAEPPQYFLDHKAEGILADTLFLGDERVLIAGDALSPRLVAAGAGAQQPLAVKPQSPVFLLQDDAFATEGEAQSLEDGRATDGRAVRVADGGRVLLDLKEHWPGDAAGECAVFAAVRVEGAAESEATIRGGVFTQRGESPASWPSLSIPQGSYHWVLLDSTQEKAFRPHEWVNVYVGLSDAPQDVALWIDCIVLVPHAGAALPYHVRSWPVTSLARAPSGSSCYGIVEGASIAAWSADDGKLLWEWQNKYADIIAGTYTLNCLSVGERRAAIGTTLGDVVLLDAATGKTETIVTGVGDRNAIRSIVMMPEDSLAAVGTSHGALRLARFPKGEIIARADEAHLRSIDSLARSDDGRLLVSGGLDRKVRLWRVSDNSLQPLFTLGPFSGPVRSVRLSGDGKMLAVLVQDEHAVRLWRLDALGEEFARLGI